MERRCFGAWHCCANLAWNINTRNNSVCDDEKVKWPRQMLWLYWFSLQASQCYLLIDFQSLFSLYYSGRLFHFARWLAHTHQCDFSSSQIFAVNRQNEIRWPSSHSTVHTQKPLCVPSIYTVYFSFSLSLSLLIDFYRKHTQISSERNSESR